MSTNNIVPRLFVKSHGEQTTKLALQLTRAPRKIIVRLTGGCGSLSPADAEGMYDLFTEAFAGFDGAMVFGGTRMISREDPEEIIPGITEISPRLRPKNPNMVLLGVVPRTEDITLTENGMVVSDEKTKSFVTIIHPQQDIVLLVQVGPDNPEIWDAEYRECLDMTEDLRKYAGFQSVLVSYNGGTVTKREILATAERGWPVILIQGSGRSTDELAADETWLKNNPNVMVAEKTPEDLRQCLILTGAIAPERLRLIRNTG